MSDGRYMCLILGITGKIFSMSPLHFYKHYTVHKKVSRGCLWHSQRGFLFFMIYLVSQLQFFISAFGCCKLGQTLTLPKVAQIKQIQLML